MLAKISQKCLITSGWVYKNITIFVKNNYSKTGQTNARKA